MKKLVAMIITMLMILSMSIMTYAGTEEEATKAITIINGYRQANGLAVLTFDSGITVATKLRAAEASVNFSHIRPDGTPWYTINNNIYGECLAKGFERAEDIISAWMNSPTHKSEVLGDYSNINVQIYTSANGEHYWAAEFE